MREIEKILCVFLFHLIRDIYTCILSRVPSSDKIKYPTLEYSR